MPGFQKACHKQEFNGHRLATMGDGTCGPRAAIQGMILSAKASGNPQHLEQVHAFLQKILTKHKNKLYMDAYYNNSRYPAFKFVHPFKNPKQAEEKFTESMEQLDSLLNKFIEDIRKLNLDTLTDKYFASNYTSDSELEHPTHTHEISREAKMLTLLSECLRLDIGDFLSDNKNFEKLTGKITEGMLTGEATSLGEISDENLSNNLSVIEQAATKITEAREHFKKTQIWVNMQLAQEYFAEKGFEYTAAVDKNYQPSAENNGKLEFATILRSQHYETFIPKNRYEILSKINADAHLHTPTANIPSATTVDFTSKSKDKDINLGRLHKLEFHYGRLLSRHLIILNDKNEPVINPLYKKPHTYGLANDTDEKVIEKALKAASLIEPKNEEINKLIAVCQELQKIAKPLPLNPKFEILDKGPNLQVIVFEAFNDEENIEYAKYAKRIETALNIMVQKLSARNQVKLELRSYGKYEDLEIEISLDKLKLILRMDDSAWGEYADIKQAISQQFLREDATRRTTPTTPADTPITPAAAPVPPAVTPLINSAPPKTMLPKPQPPKVQAQNLDPANFEKNLYQAVKDLNSKLAHSAGEQPTPKYEVRKSQKSTADKSIYRITREIPNSPNGHILESKITLDKASHTASQELGPLILNDDEAIKRNAEILIQAVLASKPEEPLCLNFGDGDHKKTLVYAKAIKEALAHANPKLKIEVECAIPELKDKLDNEVFTELLKNTHKPTNF